MDGADGAPRGPPDISNSEPVLLGAALRLAHAPSCSVVSLKVDNLGYGATKDDVRDAVRPLANALAFPRRPRAWRIAASRVRVTAQFSRFGKIGDLYIPLVWRRRGAPGFAVAR